MLFGPPVLPVSELIHGHGQVHGELLVTGVGVVVILRQQVNIVEENAAPVFISESLPHPDVQQFGPVKGTVPPLKTEKRRQIERWTRSGTSTGANTMHSM